MERSLELSIIKSSPILYEYLDVIECPNSWYKIIKELSDKIEIINNIFIDINLEIKVYAKCVKEKFGSLRFYYTSVNNTNRQYSEYEQNIINNYYKTIDVYIKQASQKSTKICYNCSKDGARISTKGWITYLCNKCYNEKK